MRVSTRCGLTLLGFLFVVLYLAVADTSLARLDQDSRFVDAHDPLSELEYNLFQLEERWNRVFGHEPDLTTYEGYPLLARAGIWISIIHNHHSDVLEVGALVTDVEGFAQMSKSEREQLLLDIVSTLPMWYGPALFIVDGEYSTETLLRAEFFRVSLMLGAETPDGGASLTKSVPLPWRLGADMDGQAGYADGRFVYSNDSYLYASLTEDGWRRGAGQSGYSTRHE